MYNVYLGDMLCPVAPERIVLGYGGGCEVFELADGEEVSVYAGSKLRSVEFSLLLPNRQYPFAVYKDGFKPARFFIEKLKELLTSGKPFRFIVTRPRGGEALGATNIGCYLDSLRVIDDANEGFDSRVELVLREYRSFAPRKLDAGGFQSSSFADVPGYAAPRSRDSSPEPKSESRAYTVVHGDCLWMIAQRFYGNGELYSKIYDANREVFKGRSPKHLIFTGDRLLIPPLS